MAGGSRPIAVSGAYMKSFVRPSGVLAIGDIQKTECYAAASACQSLVVIYPFYADARLRQQSQRALRVSRSHRPTAFHSPFLLIAVRTLNTRSGGVRCRSGAHRLGLAENFEERRALVRCPLSRRLTKSVRRRSHRTPADGISRPRVLKRKFGWCHQACALPA